ncbi:MAG: metallophosphoesterase [Kiritimatiellae bacterium]|nr:metallophosphoesterase [Kiritimatiellia bacterium]
MNKIFAVNVFAATVALAGSKELVRNGSFEEVEDGKAVGWPSAKYYNYAARSGMNGTGGVIYDNTSEKNYRALITQDVPFRHGQRYVFSVWQKTENISRPPTICAEWFDADGRYIGGTYSPGAAGTHDWTKLESITPPIPLAAKTLRLRTYVKKGGLGKAWFDDVSMKPYIPKAFGGLYCSAYRNSAANGKVLFRAPINTDKKSKAVYSWKDSSGNDRFEEVAVSREGYAEIEIDVLRMALGHQKVSCVLYSSDGKKIGGGECGFTRTEVNDCRVWIDRKGRTIVDGKAFFPLGMYVDRIPAGEKFVTYTNSPFNCMMPYGMPKSADMDRVHDAGQKVIFPIHKYHPFKKRAVKGATTPEKADRLVTEKIREFKEHPALLAWYTCDETSLEHIDALTRRQRLVEREDVHHPTWTVLYQYSQVRGYYDSFDVIGTDPYPVDSSSIGMAADWARITRDEVMGLRPMWQVVQSFDWKDYGRKTGRMPTRSEMTSMTWHAIANGANGIVYFTHRLLYRDGGKRFLRDRWEDICAAAEGVQRFIPVLLSDEKASAAKSSNPHVSIRTQCLNGKLYLIITNCDDKPCLERIVFSSSVGEPVSEYGVCEARWAADKEIDVHLPAQGYGVFSFGAQPKAERLPPLPKGAFTYVVIPDTQLYRGAGTKRAGTAPKQTETRNPAFKSRVEWILANLENEKISFVSHVGDIVDMRNEHQWNFASKLIARMDGKVPFGLSVGNHDSEGGDTVASGFTKAFPASRYESYPWYVAQTGNNANSCQLFEEGTMKFVVLHLECNAPEEVLCWADAQLEKYSDRIGIVVTHMYLGFLTEEHDKVIRYGKNINTLGYADWFGVMTWKKVHGEKGMTAQETWDAHFSKHKNLFLILCGDQSLATTWRHLQFGKHGNRVYSILQDYPRRGDLEDWLRLLRFRPDKGVVEVYTYSPAQDRLCHDAGVWHGRSWHQFEIPLPDGK